MGITNSFPDHRLLKIPQTVLLYIDLSKRRFKCHPTTNTTFGFSTHCRFQTQKTLPNKHIPVKSCFSQIFVEPNPPFDFPSYPKNNDQRPKKRLSYTVYSNHLSQFSLPQPHCPWRSGFPTNTQFQQLHGFHHQRLGEFRRSAGWWYSSRCFLLGTGVNGCFFCFLFFSCAVVFGLPKKLGCLFMFLVKQTSKMMCFEGLTSFGWIFPWKIQVQSHWQLN